MMSDTFDDTLVIRQTVVPIAPECTATPAMSGSTHRTPTAPTAATSSSRSTTAGDVGWRLQAEARASNLGYRGLLQGTGLAGWGYLLLEAGLVNVAWTRFLGQRRVNDGVGARAFQKPSTYLRITPSVTRWSIG